MWSFLKEGEVSAREFYAPKKLPKEEQALKELEDKDDFMKMATKIADLIKEYGTMPTPRQLKIRLDIDAKRMRAVCGDCKCNPYDLLIREAKEILRKRDGVMVGFGRLEPVSDENNTPR